MALQQQVLQLEVAANTEGEGVVVVMTITETDGSIRYFESLIIAFPHIFIFDVSRLTREVESI